MIAVLDLETGFLSDQRLGKRDLKVLIALAVHADKHTGECWPSRSRLSELTALNESKISAATKNLSDWGYIKKIQSVGKGNRYRILKPLPKSVPVPKRGGVPKQAPTPPQNGTGPLPKTGTQNIPITKKEQTNPRCWLKFTYSKFQKLEDRPEPDQNFELLWKKYRKVCVANKSNEGGKLKAWFYYLQCMDSGFKDDQINASLGRYISKKEKSSEKLKNLSNVLNDQELLKQLSEEIQEEKEQIEKTKIKGIDTRF